jgi:hypothetical protein
MAADRSRTCASLLLPAASPGLTHACHVNLISRTNQHVNFVGHVSIYFIIEMQQHPKNSRASRR